jgi:hypothetical protein
LHFDMTPLANNHRMEAGPDEGGEFFMGVTHQGATRIHDFMASLADFGEPALARAVGGDEKGTRFHRIEVSLQSYPVSEGGSTLEKPTL